MSITLEGLRLWPIRTASSLLAALPLSYKNERSFLAGFEPATLPECSIPHLSIIRAIAADPRAT